MTETAPLERPRRANSKRDRALGPALVSGNCLARHFGVTRQHVQKLAHSGVIERGPGQLFDQEASRLRYLAHLRTERSRSPRSVADTEHTAIKTQMLKLKLMEKRAELCRQSDVDELIDQIVGITLTAMSSMPARCAPRGDLATRRRIEEVVFEVRTEIANISQRKADEYREPPLDQQG
jgi:hypothetical protein